MKNFFIPRSDGDRLAWLNNFKSKIGVLGPSLGMTAAQITTAQNQAQGWIDALQSKLLKKAEYHTKVAAERVFNKSGPNTLRGEINRIKSGGNFTEAMGEELMIQSGGSNNVDVDTHKVEANCKVNGRIVKLTFKKRGAQGVNIYCRLVGETKWEFLATDAKSPYYDNRPLKVEGAPEAREYQVWPVVEFEQVGVPSDIMTALVG